MTTTSLTLLRQVTELMEQRERQMAEAGEWRRVDWEWRREWRHRAQVIAAELQRLGRGW